MPKLISLLSAKYNSIIKVIKLLYGIFKVSNYWFAIYYMYYKKKLRIIELTYDFCFFYRSGLLKIVKMQIDNILILANNNFASIKEKTIKNLNIMTKD